MDEFNWSEKYRPKTVDDVILPDEIRVIAKKFVEQEHLPNMLLKGGPGVGKTTLAKAMCEDLQCDYYVVNGSLDRNIDTLRVDIMEFASSTSLFSSKKCIIIDEADYLNPNSTQPALRSFMDEYSKNCSFVFTCNYPYKLIDPLISRFTTIDFDRVEKEDKQSMLLSFFKRTQQILQSEGVYYDKKALSEFIMFLYPDWRKCINELQRHSAFGDIDADILKGLQKSDLDILFEFMKRRNFFEMRKWVTDNDKDLSNIMGELADESEKHLEPSAVPGFHLTCADYQKWQPFVPDRELNTIACLTQLMMDGGFK